MSETPTNHHLGIPIVSLANLADFLASSPVRSSTYTPLGPAVAAIDRLEADGKIEPETAGRLRSYIYEPQLFEVRSGPDAAPEYRISYTGSPYATTIIHARLPYLGLIFLVVFESKMGQPQGTANFVTGLIDNLERCAQSAAEQEILEEAGLSSVFRPLGSLNIWASRHHNPREGLLGIHGLMADAKIYQRSPAPNRGEHVLTAWMRAFDIFTLMRDGEPIRFEADAASALTLQALHTPELGKVMSQFATAYGNKRT